MNSARARVLAIAGSDSSGGAGIEADIKTLMALGAYAATAITAVTVQDTTGVHAVFLVPPDVVAQQVATVLNDIGADAIKTGMLGGADTVRAVARALEAKARAIPLVLDPVMAAKGGTALLQDDAVEVLKGALLPRAALVTPNAPEAERLTGLAVTDEAGQAAAGTALRTMGAEAALVKGGHIPGDTVVDVLVTGAGVTPFRAPRLAGKGSHGTGCTLASAVAAGLAQGMDLPAAVTRACAFVRAAIASAPGLGRGNGPLDHLHSISPYRGD